MAEEKEEELTRFEKARIIGARALQISGGAPFLIKMEEKDLEELKYNPIEIAKKEFDAGAIPIDVTRPLPKSTEITQEKEKAEEKEEETESAES